MTLNKEKTLIYLNNNHKMEKFISTEISIEAFKVYQDSIGQEKFPMGKILSVSFDMLTQLLEAPKSSVGLQKAETSNTFYVLEEFLKKQVLLSAFMGIENEIPHLKSYMQFITMCANNKEHCTIWDLERFHNIIDEPMTRCRSEWLTADDYSEETLSEAEILELLESDKNNQDIVVQRIKATMQAQELTRKDLPEGMRKILEQAENKQMLGNYTNYYEINSVIDLLSACLQEIFSKKKCIWICEHCGRLFVIPHRKDTKYCDFPSPENPNRNCKEQVRLEKQLQRDKAKESAAIHKRIRTMYANKYGATSDELDTFLEDSANKRNLIKSGKLTEEEYVAWLKTFYVRKYK